MHNGQELVRVFIDTRVYVTHHETELAASLQQVVWQTCDEVGILRVVFNAETIDTWELSFIFNDYLENRPGDIDSIKL